MKVFIDSLSRCIYIVYIYGIIIIDICTSLSIHLLHFVLIQYIQGLEIRSG